MSVSHRVREGESSWLFWLRAVGHSRLLEKPILTSASSVSDESESAAHSRLKVVFLSLRVFIPPSDVNREEFPSHLSSAASLCVLQCCGCFRGHHGDCCHEPVAMCRYLRGLVGGGLDNRLLYKLQAGDSLPVWTVLLLLLIHPV